MKLKKGDQVIVLYGKDKGRKGKIEKIFPKTGKILIPGVNIYKKHLKPQGEGKPGGIIDKVFPLPLANVALLCPKCNKRTRIGYQIDKENKYRICRKCGSIL
ncbi:MAG: 50S ribosomal protein L24 [Candidatus Shapirobacteria bacterium]|nr:50S ribosomal protein L24 [Candidatus Shapirobacteria bacterium]